MIIGMSFTKLLFFYVDRKSNMDATAGHRLTSFFFKSPPFLISMATAAKFVLPIPIFLAYLVPLDVDVTGNITAKLCKVWSEFNIFCTLVTMATTAI
jgi:hypothetical protein